MIWLFERGAEVLRIETRFDNATSQFELVWNRPDGSKETERFATEGTFRARLASIEAALKTDHWNISGSPQVLSNGWKDAAEKLFKDNN